MLNVRQAQDDNTAHEVRTVQLWRSPSLLGLGSGRPTIVAPQYYHAPPPRRGH